MNEIIPEIPDFEAFFQFLQRINVNNFCIFKDRELCFYKGESLECFGRRNTTLLKNDTVHKEQVDK